MAKRVDPLKAKQAKQRKVAIGLSVLLVAVLAYQGPKTLKMLKGPAAMAAPAAETATPTPTTPVPVSAGAPDTPQPVILADTNTTVDAGPGQILSFERFESNDPFQQQVNVKATSVDPTAPDDDSTPGAEPASPGVDPAIQGSAENPPISFGGGSSGPAGSSDSSGSSSGGAVPGATAPSPAAATTISVNGVSHTVTVGTPFPADQPTFELVSLAKDGKSVQIGVAGGDLADGKATVKLAVGKSLTLQNTADGSRFELVLLTVEGAAPPNG
jgi:hypothetical protein